MRNQTCCQDVKLSILLIHNFWLILIRFSRNIHTNHYQRFFYFLPKEKNYISFETELTSVNKLIYKTSNYNHTKQYVNKSNNVLHDCDIFCWYLASKLVTNDKRHSLSQFLKIKNISFQLHRTYQILRCSFLRKSIIVIERSILVPFNHFLIVFDSIHFSKNALHVRRGSFTDI